MSRRLMVIVSLVLLVGSVVLAVVVRSVVLAVVVGV
jgi:hypothetical protein